MHVRVLLQITGDDGAAAEALEIAVFEKRTEQPEDLGLTIADGKALMAGVQQRVVNAQVASWAEQHRCCEACGARRRSKGSHPVVFLTLYGDVEIASPRLHRCPCQSPVGPATVSPLRKLLLDYVAPERLYLEARWASLVPYAAAAGLLSDILPITAGANATTVREHVLRMAERAEAELAEERACSIDGCPAEWAKLPIPEGRIAVGLDGGYVRSVPGRGERGAAARLARGCYRRELLPSPTVQVASCRGGRRLSHPKLANAHDHPRSDAHVPRTGLAEFPAAAGGPCAGAVA
jgi:hypothetical protein